MDHRSSTGRRAVIMVIATLTLLVGGALGVEAAIQHRILAAPQLELRVGPLYIRASASTPQPVPACPSRSPNPNDMNAFAVCSQQFYVILVLIQHGPPDDTPWILLLLNVPIEGAGRQGSFGVHKEYLPAARLTS